MIFFFHFKRALQARIFRKNTGCTLYLEACVFVLPATHSPPIFTHSPTKKYVTPGVPGTTVWWLLLSPRVCRRSSAVTTFSKCASVIYAKKGNPESGSSCRFFTPVYGTPRNDFNGKNDFQMAKQTSKTVGGKCLRSPRYAASWQIEKYHLCRTGPLRPTCRCRHGELPRSGRFLFRSAARFSTHLKNRISDDEQSCELAGLHSTLLQ